MAGTSETNGVLNFAFASQILCLKKYGALDAHASLRTLLQKICRQLDALASLPFRVLYEKLSAPRLRWLKTTTRSGSNYEEKRKGPPVSPDLPLPDPCAVQPRSISLSTTFHLTRLPLPQETREPSTRSRRETASFHKIQNRLAPGNLVVAYFDDIYVFTRPERARAAYGMVREVLWEQCRTQVQQGKLVCWNRMGGIPPPGITELACPSNPVWRRDAPAAANGVVVVGSPIGCDEFVAQHGARHLQEEEPLRAELRDMPGTQVAWLLFYLCAVPRANHLLRTLPPQQVAPYASAHDQRMRMELRRLLGLASAEHDAVLHGLSNKNLGTSGQDAGAHGRLWSSGLRPHSACSVLGQLGRLSPLVA